MIKFNLKKIEVFYILLFVILTILYFISTINKLTYENKNLCKKLDYMYQQEKKLKNLKDKSKGVKSKDVR